MEVIMLRKNYILSITLLLSTLPMIGMENPNNHRRPILKPTAKPAAGVRNQNKQCPVCTDVKPIIAFRTLSCGHNTACAACLKNIVEQAIEQKRTATMRCPADRCNHTISENDMRKIIYDKDQQEEVAAIQLQEWIRQQPNAKQCPTANCTYAFLNADQVAGQIDCPNCEHRYCNQCLHPHAQNVNCRDAELARNPNAAERATQAWKQQNTKACPHCRVAIEKNEGCLHMTCRSCRYQFCWNCLGDWHTHYDSYNCDNRVNTPAQAQQQAAGHQRPAPQQPHFVPAAAQVAPQIPLNGGQWNAQVHYQTTLTIPFFVQRVNIPQVNNHFAAHNIRAVFDLPSRHVTLSGPVDAIQMYAQYTRAINLGIL